MPIEQSVKPVSFCATVRQLAAVALLSLASAAQADGFSWSKDVSAMPESGTGTSFGTDQMSLMLPLQENQGREEGLRTSAGLTVTSFEWTGSDAASSQYFWLSMPIQYWQRRMTSGQIRIRFEPGLMTDFDNINTDSLMANLQLYWRQQMSGDWFWQAGLMVDRRFGDVTPRPMAGIAWKAFSSTELLLGLPETRLQTGWNKHFTSYLNIRPDGGVWREAIEGLDGSYDVRYRNWRMGLGADFWWRGNIWINAELGQQRLRKITAHDSTGAKVTANPADNNYWQAGIKVKF